MTGAARQPGRRHTKRVFAPRSQHEAERELAAQAEAAYLRLMRDWRSGPTRAGAGVTRGRVKTPTKQRGSAAARQTSEPQDSALQLVSHPHPRMTLAQGGSIVEKT